MTKEYGAEDLRPMTAAKQFRYVVTVPSNGIPGEYHIVAAMFSDPADCTAWANVLTDRSYFDVRVGTTNDVPDFNGMSLVDEIVYPSIASSVNMPAHFDQLPEPLVEKVRRDLKTDIDAG